MMVKKKIQISRGSIDPTKIDNLQLSIQISLDGFSFCTLNKVTNTVDLLSYVPFSEPSVNPEKHLDNVITAFNNESALQFKYSNVNICHTNNLSTIVPRELFNEHNLKGYLKYNLKVYENDFIAYDKISTHEMINVYVPFVNINNFFIDKFGEFEYKHSTTIFLQNILNVYKLSEKPHFFAHIHGNQLDLIAIANNQLQLSNSFTFQNKTDFIYYLLFCAEQLRFNPEYLELVFLGEVIENDSLYNIAYKYIKNVSFLENRSPYNYSDAFNDDIKRQYFLLLHQN
ncbi:DUF3822 family protein [Namhaeicola litoreus]|uniref:DUF3822 family protein n=1 Tax=Namhaeicola litoreus TaxID=1052145 RepID=A0ABW3Y5N5_9FLAO